MTRGQAVRMPTVARNIKYSQSMVEVAPQGISDAIGRLINALIVEVITGRYSVDWTTLKVSTKKRAGAEGWETIVSVEEKK